MFDALIQKLTGPGFWMRYGGIYDGLLNNLVYRETVQQVAEALAPEDGQCILDAGCGTGNYSFELLRREPKCRLTAMDASAEMRGHAALNHPVSQDNPAIAARWRSASRARASVRAGCAAR